MRSLPGGYHKAALYGVKMRTFWGRKGKPITLPCTLPVPDDTNFSLEWRKDNKLIMSAYGAEPGHAAPSLQGLNESMERQVERNICIEVQIGALPSYSAE
ncbi:hypothetical protein COOONC_01946 [Cooperia oncophora]